MVPIGVTLGGVIKDEKQIKPEEYGELTQRLKPIAAQISGGEPLLREDIADIVKAIKQAGVQYAILVTNGVLLNESSYLQLREAGVNQFSVSLDFPDERHDEFRQRPGLYKRLEQSLPRMASLGFQDIILNTAITKANLREILPLAKRPLNGCEIYLKVSALSTLKGAVLELFQGRGSPASGVFPLQG
jgi:MoaA/NifB/PqqE/SkfB family radical SAM enzyme